MSWLWMLIGGIAIGFLLGCIVCVCVDRKNIYGTIKIDDGSSLYLVMEKSPSELKKAEYAMFKVDMSGSTDSHE